MRAALGHAAPLPADHRDRLRAAVDPYLDSEHHLDRLSAAHMHRAMPAV